MWNNYFEKLWYEIKYKMYIIVKTFNFLGIIVVRTEGRKQEMKCLWLWVWVSSHCSFVVVCLLEGVQQCFSYTMAVNFIGGGNRRTQRKPPTCRKSLTYHIMLSTSPWLRFELTTSVVIGTDCMGSCKSNYNTITSMTAPSFVVLIRNICIL